MAIDFPFARTLVGIQSRRTEKRSRKSTLETRHNPSSEDQAERTHEGWIDLVRGHRAEVEHRNRWRRDALWGEGGTRSRKPNIVANVALLRSTAVGLLNHHHPDRSHSDLRESFAANATLSLALLLSQIMNQNKMPLGLPLGLGGATNRLDVPGNCGNDRPARSQAMKNPNWAGVFPAITTQMDENGALDLAGTARHAEALIESGISGLIFLGSLGENQSLTAEEKRQVIQAMVAMARGRIPVLSGVAESSLGEAIRFARDGEKAGLSGFMLMPPMIYKSPDPEESLHHFRTVARATGLPIMIYNNPPSYGHDITPELYAELAGEENFVALKESSGNTRRITDIRNLLGDRYAIFTGVDDLALESAILGIDGWVAGSGIAFPAENQRFWDLTRMGRWEEAREIYRWFAPLLHLDTHPKFVQYIKLAVQEAGLGREWTRAPRLPLAGAERKAILKVIHDGMAKRPKLPQ